MKSKMKKMMIGAMALIFASVVTTGSASASGSDYLNSSAGPGSKTGSVHIVPGGEKACFDVTNMPGVIGGNQLLYVWVYEDDAVSDDNVGLLQFQYNGTKCIDSSKYEIGDQEIYAEYQWNYYSTNDTRVTVY